MSKKTEDFLSQSKEYKKLDLSSNTNVPNIILELLEEHKQWLFGETGRPKKYQIDDTVKEVFRELEKGEVQVKEAIEKLGTSRTQFYRMRAEYQEIKERDPKVKTKVCSKCGMEKPLTEFGRDKKGKQGRRADCKECYDKMRAEKKKEKARKEQGNNLTLI